MKPPRSACDILKVLLEKPLEPDLKIGFFPGFDYTYSKETVNLARAIKACELDMVGHPLSTMSHLRFTTREKYLASQEQTDQKSKSTWIPRFGNKSSE